METELNRIARILLAKDCKDQRRYDDNDRVIAAAGPSSGKREDTIRIANAPKWETA